MARMTYYLTAIFIFILSVGCIAEIDTKITLKEDTSPPTFVIEGSGHLSRFVIYGPLVGEYATENDRPVAWKIFPDKESSDIPVSDLPPIKYGVPPAGWTQYYPSNGTTDTLIEGAMYRAVANTNSANSGYIDFTIQQGKVRVLTQPASNSDGR